MGEEGVECGCVDCVYACAIGRGHNTHLPPKCTGTDTHTHPPPPHTPTHKHTPTHSATHTQPKHHQQHLQHPQHPPIITYLRRRRRPLAARGGEADAGGAHFGASGRRAGGAVGRAPCPGEGVGVVVTAVVILYCVRRALSLSLVGVVIMFLFFFREGV